MEQTLLSAQTPEQWAYFDKITRLEPYFPHEQLTMFSSSQLDILIAYKSKVDEGFRYYTVFMVMLVYLIMALLMYILHSYN